MSTTRGDRLRAARLARGLSQSAAAKALGIPPSTYSAHERAQTPGGRDFNPEEARNYARLFKTRVDWLMTSNGPPPQGVDRIENVRVGPVGRRKGKTLIKGYLGASTLTGALYNFGPDDRFEEIARPSFASDWTAAVEIKGKGAAPLIDGMLVFFDDNRAPVTDDLVGSTCVIGLADNRILLKKIERAPGGTIEEVIEGAKIEWAARMIAIAPR